MLLSDAMMPDCLNVQIRDGEVHRAKMRSAMLAALPLGVIHYHWFQTSGIAGYLFAFTATSIYKWDTATSAWVEWLAEGEGKPGTAGLATCTKWSAVTYLGKVVATNGVDKVLIGDNDEPFDWLGSASGVEVSSGVFLTAAKNVSVFENYLFLDYTIEGGDTYPTRTRRSDLVSFDFMTGDAGSTDVEGDDAIVGCGLYQGYRCVFKERSWHKMWLGGPYVFTIVGMSREIGCWSPDSIVNNREGKLYFLDSAKHIREIQDGIVSDDVDAILRQIPDDAIQLVRGWRVDDYGEVWWSIPYGPVAACNRILTFKDGVWGQRGVATPALGSYREQQTYTIDGLDAYFATIDEWDWEGIDSVEGSAGFPLNICADDSGNTYSLHNSTLDAGAEFEGYFVLAADLTGNTQKTLYKKLLRMQPIFRGRQEGEATIYVKRDGEAEWQEAGSVSLIGTAEFITPPIPCRFRAKEFQFRISAANPFEFVGMTFDFVFDGVN